MTFLVFYPLVVDEEKSGVSEHGNVRLTVRVGERDQCLTGVASSCKLFYCFILRIYNFLKS